MLAVSVVSLYGLVWSSSHHSMVAGFSPEWASLKSQRARKKLHFLMTWPGSHISSSLLSFPSEPSQDSLRVQGKENCLVSLWRVSKTRVTTMAIFGEYNLWHQVNETRQDCHFHDMEEKAFWGEPLSQCLRTLDENELLSCRPEPKDYEGLTWYLSP